MLDKLDLEVSRRTVFQAVAAAATVLAIGTAQAGTDTAPTFRTTGGQFTFVEPRPAVPAIRLELVNGSTLDLGTPIGKPRLISVWATWCPPCRRELPTLERLAKLLGAEVQVTAVSIDREGSARVRAFLDNLGVRLPSALDPTGRLVKSVGDWEAAPITMWGMPISYVVDRRGRIAGYFVGEADWTSPDALALLRYFAHSEP